MPDVNSLRRGIKFVLIKIYSSICRHDVKLLSHLRQARHQQHVMLSSEIDAVSTFSAAVIVRTIVYSRIVKELERKEKMSTIGGERQIKT